MKSLFDLLKPKGNDGKAAPKKAPSDASTGAGESSLFVSTFTAGPNVHPGAIAWEARAVEVAASKLPKIHGRKSLEQVWKQDANMSQLSVHAIERLQRFFVFASIPPSRDVIRQDEYGSFMVVLLAGSIGVDRRQPWGEYLRLAETRPGDILGEMSLLDGGIRFSTCTTLTDCEVAVLSAEALEDMLTNDAPLAAALVSLLARKLSLRLRVVSSRLSDNPNG